VLLLDTGKKEEGYKRVVGFENAPTFGHRAPRWLEWARWSETIRFDLWSLNGETKAVGRRLPETKKC
jgi:hypothetical protein